MKKTNKLKSFLALFISVVLLSLSLVGCTSDDSSKAAVVPAKSDSTTAVAGSDATMSPLTGSKDEEYYLISFLSGLDYWKTVYKGFEQAGKSFGIKTVYAGDPGYDINKSITVFEQIAAKKPAGIAIAAINADALAEPIKKARAEGIEVVTYDSDSPASGRSSFLSTGNKAAGSVAAEHMAKLVNKKGEIALVYSIGQQNVEERIAGFEETLKKSYPDMKITAKVNDKGDQTEAAKALAAALQANPNIAGVFCADGVAGVGGTIAVKEAGKEGEIKIIGFDTDKALLDMIKDGSIDASIAQGTINMGYWSMNFLFHLKHKLSPDPLPGYVDTGVNVVTKENVESYYVK